MNCSFTGELFILLQENSSDSFTRAK
ncbi:hypothetical protein HNY73_011836 [Argiope bruennichi]|uniref:Uncharacterized protein n=1 Tax=Argiope bruennichi TaxID=94029 RepID=A0A8T0ET89_ARGBR|nr:hypothetical protein HNY73_011836 [Argiope bruennichi]